MQLPVSLIENELREFENGVAVWVLFNLLVLVGLSFSGTFAGIH